LIKIGVALDNGEILSFDARGYITNHTTRQLGEPAISEDEARSKLSERLTAKKGKLCVIPSDGQNEIYCWEFEGQDQNGMNVLVYINAQTGKEERILLLQISENGILTV
jgi:germination protein YpeB